MPLPDGSPTYREMKADLSRKWWNMFVAEIAGLGLILVGGVYVWRTWFGTIALSFFAYHLGRGLRWMWKMRSFFDRLDEAIREDPRNA